MLTRRELLAEDLGDLLDLGLAVDDIDAVSSLGDHRFVVVVLVLDVADDHLDDVLQRNQAVCAAIFVDDQRHLGACRLHALHQVGCEHRRRHEQNGADEVELTDGAVEVDLGEIERRVGCLGLARPALLDAGATGDVGQHVADMDHASGIVERLDIDRHARMSRLLDKAQQLAQRGAELDRLDVGARDHDVLDADFAQSQDVVEHRPFAGREGIGVTACLGQRIGDLLADVAAVAALPEESAQPLDEGRPFGLDVMRRGRRRGRTRLVFGLFGGLGRRSRFGSGGSLLLLVHLLPVDCPSLLRVGIGNGKPRERPPLQRFHLFRFFIGLVIIP